MNESRDAKIHDSYAALIIQHDIRGLQIPVQHPLVMSSGQSLANLSRNLQGLCSGYMPDTPQQIVQVIVPYLVPRNLECSRVATDQIG